MEGKIPHFTHPNEMIFSLERSKTQGKHTRPHHRPKPLNKIIFLIFLSLAILSCQITPVQEPSLVTTTNPSQPTTEPILMAEVFFWVEIPENTPDNEGIQLVVMDEVTGLPYNQKRMDMIPIDPTHYGVAVQSKLGSVIKYRYERKSGAYSQEFNLSGDPVRYRMYLMNGPGLADTAIRVYM